MFNEQNAFEFLKELSFPRLAGSHDEHRAAEIIRKSLKKAGVSCRLEPFKISAYDKTNATLEVLEPYKKTYTANAIGLAGNTPAKGITAEFLHLTTYDHFTLNSAKGKIAMFYNSQQKEFYGKLKKYKIPAFVRIIDHPENDTHLSLMYTVVDKYGKIPGVSISYETALELIHRKAKKAKIRVSQKEFKGTSHNVTAEIKGTAFPDEIIFACAHYDSVMNCAGAVDNASGSASILEFARYFKKNPPLRTIRFAWFGSEELGMLGSFAYVKKHKKDIKKIKFLVNMDMTASIIGSNSAYVCGSKSFKDFVTSAAREKGIPMDLQQEAYSSDNIPFNDYKVPSIAFHRSGGHYYHTFRDEFRLINAENMQMLGEFCLDFLRRCANAPELPFTLDIEEKDREDTIKYIKDRLLMKPAPEKKAAD